ncbi:MAG: hypothetical protein ACRC7O_03110 [Fimbriiglobus sp.]
MGKVANRATPTPAGKPRPSAATKPATKKSGSANVFKTPAELAVSTTEFRPPLTDEEVGPIPGLPSEADIESHVGALSPADKRRFTTIRTLLARRLGSLAAARVWLTTPGRGFDGTPLDAVRNGMADLVLDALKQQSGPNPTYA